MEEAKVKLVLNSVEVTASTSMTVAALLLREGVPSRRSISGEDRSPVCSMGVCMECRVWVDGRKVRSCLVECREGMEVRTDG
jgi:sarcosine oxidase subunit alpha